MMRLKVYLETTVLSYLTAWPSRDLVIAAHQQITRDWWQKRRGSFELFVSQAVYQEASAGDSSAAQLRLDAMKGIAVLELKEGVVTFSNRLVSEVPLPRKAAVDSLHIAVAAMNGMHYLLTWNCAHLANAALRTKIESICREAGYEPPIICTPEELMGEE